MTTQELPTINLRESRTFDGVLRATFVFIRTMFKPLLRSVLAITGIPALVMFILTFFVTLTTESVDGFWIQFTIIFVEFRFASSLTPIIAVVWLCPYFFFYVSTSVFIVLCTKNGNQPPTPTEVWIGAKRNLRRLAGTFFLVPLSIAFSLLFFLIPGVYVSVALWMVCIVQLHEDLKFFDAVNRCFELIKGYWWQTCGILFICQLCFVSVSYLSVSSHTLLNVFASTAVGDTSYSALSALVSFLSFVVILLSSLPLLIAPAIQYYNLVERKEAHGLQKRISEIEQTLHDVPPNSASAL